MTDAYTPEDRSDDRLTSFSAAGPTFEGFVKPDLVAPGGHVLGLMGPAMEFPRSHPEAHGDHLYGSVSAADIATAIEEQTGVVVDRRTLALDHPIKEVGQSVVMCKLHPEVEFPVTVEVSGE